MTYFPGPKRFLRNVRNKEVVSTPHFGAAISGTGTRYEALTEYISYAYALFDDIVPESGESNVKVIVDANVQEYWPINANLKVSHSNQER